MEHIGAIFEGEWNSLNGMSSEEAEFMAQLLGNCSLPNDANFPVPFWPSNENIESTMYSGDGTSTSVYSFSQGSSYFPSVSDHVFVGNNDLMAMDYCMEDKNDSIESNINMCEDVLQGTKPESKKRSRIPREGGRNVKVNKCAKVVREEDNNNNDDNAVVVHRQNSSSCSEDDSNVMTHSSSSKGKTRADRGSATDPQSLYARKRRERINERLKILQKLVPNGTKVDISTMLEEAVQYVKFLQLQIKLLSSDDMWMYAPIAYNGMDIGLDLKISTLRPQS